MANNPNQTGLAVAVYREAGRAVVQYVMCEEPSAIGPNLDDTTSKLERGLGTTWPFASTERDDREWAWCGCWKNLGETIPPERWARIHRRHGFRRIVTLWAGVIAQAFGESLLLSPDNGMMLTRPIQYFIERGDANIDKATETAKNYLVRIGAQKLTWGKFQYQDPKGAMLYSEDMTAEEQQAYFAFWKAREKLREAWEAIHVDPTAAKLVRRLYPVAVRLVQNHLEAITHLHKVLMKKWPLGVVRGIMRKPIIVPSKQVQEILDDFYARRSRP